MKSIKMLFIKTISHCHRQCSQMYFVPTILTEMCWLGGKKVYKINGLTREKQILQKKCAGLWKIETPTKEIWWLGGKTHMTLRCYICFYIFMTLNKAMHSGPVFISYLWHNLFGRSVENRTQVGRQNFMPAGDHGFICLWSITSI